MNKYGFLGVVLFVAGLISCASESATERVDIPRSARETCPTDTTMESLAKTSLLVSGANDVTVINDYYDNDGYLLGHSESSCDPSLSYGACVGERPDMSSWQSGYVFLHFTMEYGGSVQEDRWQCYYYRKVSTTESF